MSKKLISLLLAICMLFCLSACGTTETSSNPTNTPPESQTNTAKDNNENTFSEENSQVSSNTEETNENDNTQTQPQTNQSKPTSTTNQPTHTHSYSNATCTSPKKCSCGATAGTALGHQFSSATCTSPQICSRCGTTSGNALGHNYVKNKCSRCGKVDPDSLPVGLNSLFLVDSFKYKYKNGAFTDSFGNSYNGAHYYTNLYESRNGKEPHSIHNLNNSYKSFSGSIVASTTTYADSTYYINIYTDNNLVFSKTNFTRTSGKVDFKIDVTNCQTLKIVSGLETGSGDYRQELCIVNAQLSK